MFSHALLKKSLFRFIAAGFLVVVVLASFVPPTVVSPGRWNLGHLPAYAFLTGAVILSLRRPDCTGLMVFGVTVAISLFGLVIEFLQPLVGRTTSAVDFALNVVGVISGVAIWAAYAGVKGAMNSDRHCAAGIAEAAKRG